MTGGPSNAITNLLARLRGNYPYLEKTWIQHSLAHKRMIVGSFISIRSNRDTVVTTCGVSEQIRLSCSQTFTPHWLRIYLSIQWTSVDILTSQNHAADLGQMCIRRGHSTNEVREAGRNILETRFMLETMVRMNTYSPRTGKEFGRRLRVSGSLLTWAVASQFSIETKSHTN